MLPAGANAGRKRKHWWLSRALYRCKHLPLGHVVATERRAVLRNLLLAWAPFDQADYRVAWQGDAALAVAWDRVAVEALLASAGAPTTATLWPETFLREPWGQDGVRVLQGLEGVEAQVWRNRSLHVSRWWPQRPAAGEAQTWLRSLGTDATTLSALPVALPAAWRRRPWAELQGLDGLLSTSSRLERVAVGAALVGFTALTAAQAHQVFAAYEEREAQQRERERIQLDAAPVLAARDRAESLAREAASLASQLTGVLPLEVLQHLSAVLPPRGVTLKELELSGQQLRLALELAPDLQRSAVVKDLQSGGWLSKVNEARDSSNRGWVVFDAALLSQRAPVSTARPVAAAAMLPSLPSVPVVRPAPATVAPSPPAPSAILPDAAAQQPSGAPEGPAVARPGFVPSGQGRAAPQPPSTTPAPRQ